MTRWTSTQLKFGTTLKGRVGWQGLKSDEYTDEGPLVVSSAHFSNEIVHWEKCPRVTHQRYEMDPSIQLKNEDILLMKDGAALGKLAYVSNMPEKACLNSHLLVIRPVDKRVLDSKFLFYLLFAQDFQSYMTLNGTGSTFAGVSQTAIGRYRFSYPGYHTQRQIATYLDKKTEAIDTLIAKKQMMIELLEEKRSALINHVVTKGLNPDAPMKDSGVPWIGEVPAHWRIKKGKTLFKELNRTIPKHSNIVTVFRDGEVTLRINRRTEGFTIALKEIGYQGVNKGDLVINSMDAFAGAIGVSDSTGRCTPEYVVLSPLREAHPLYYKHLLRLMASSEYILVQCSAVRQRAPRFRFSHFATTLLAEPPKEEQIKIADVIQLETSKTSHLISSLGTQFTKLQEYRQSLITAAVTGKIDVTRDPTSDDPEEAVSGQGTLF